jgi:hypothetical protein
MTAGWTDMNEPADRRSNPALRGRIDEYLARVRAAREEIVQRALDAVHGPESRDEADASAAREHEQSADQANSELPDAPLKPR